jgi:hypothetical protein
MLKEKLRSDLSPAHGHAAIVPSRFFGGVTSRECPSDPESSLTSKSEDILMARKIGLLLGILIVTSLPAKAQDKVEVFGGYSYMRFRGGPSANLNGWEISGQYKFTDWLGGVADVDGHYGSLRGVGTSMYTYLFGPQVSFPARVSPFAHVLLGGAHISAAGFGNSSFSMAIGGGIDTELMKGIHWRIIQGDYLMTRFGSNTQNNARLSTGIVLRF